MDFSLVIYFVLVGLGILVGFNLRNNYAEKKEGRTYDEVDAEIRKELEVATNLNKSLLEDVAYLRKKVDMLTTRK